MTRSLFLCILQKSMIVVQCFSVTQRYYCWFMELPKSLLVSDMQVHNFGGGDLDSHDTHSGCAYGIFILYYVVVFICMYCICCLLA